MGGNFKWEDCMEKKLAVLQIDSVLGNVNANLQKIASVDSIKSLQLKIVVHQSFSYSTKGPE